MVYAYDLWAPMPTMDLYDTQMMLASVNAAKDMYDKAEKQLELFRKDYSDFYSPFAKDMERYRQIVGGVQDQINDMYARGIDPLRSREGRAMLAGAIRGIDPAEMSLMKTNAKYGQVYLSALAELQSKNKYSKDLEDYMLNRLGIPAFDEFSSASGNVWNRLSPIEYQSLQEATNDWYKNRQAHYGDAADVRSFLDSNGNPYQPRAGYKYKVFTNNDLLNIASNNTPGWNGSIMSDYYRDVARRELELAGNTNPSPEQIEQLLQKDIAYSQQGYLVAPQEEVDEWALARYKENAAAQRLRMLAEMRAAPRNGKNSGNGNKSNNGDVNMNDMDIAITASHLLKQTKVGRDAGIGAPSDYNSLAAEELMYDAQKEIASSIYDYDKVNTSIPSIFRSGQTKTNNLGNALTESIFRDRGVTMDGGPKDKQWYERHAQDLARQNLNRYQNQYRALGVDNSYTAYDINFNGPYLRPLTPGEKPSRIRSISYPDIRLPNLEQETARLLAANPAYVNYSKNLHQQNLRYLETLSIPSSATEFANMFDPNGGNRDSDNKLYRKMDLSEKSRIYSADEVALCSAGVNRPTDAKEAIRTTKSLRAVFGNNWKNGQTEIVSDGMYLGRVGEDGAYHIFEKVRIYNRVDWQDDDKNKLHKWDDMFPELEVYYDRGVATQQNPDFQFTHSANMGPLTTGENFFTDRKRLSGVGLSGTQVKSNSSVPFIQDAQLGNEEDLLEDLIEEYIINQVE